MQYCLRDLLAAYHPLDTPNNREITFNEMSIWRFLNFVADMQFLNKPQQHKAQSHAQQMFPGPPEDMCGGHRAQ